MNVLIIGPGLIGGSFGLMLKKADHTIAGYDISQDHLVEAQQLGLIERAFSDLYEALQWADGVILSIPVGAIKESLPKVLDIIQQYQFVIDFGSTKSTICESVAYHENRSRFLAAHPIAGTEYSGPSAAFPGLYEGKTMIMCETEKTDSDVVEIFRGWCALGNMSLVDMTPQNHDKHLAYISHLSHVIAFSLSNAVLEKERDDNLILELAGSGFASTVRLAKSSPEMWTSIFLENQAPLLDAIDNLLSKIETMKDSLSNGDQEKLNQFLEEGREIRKILD